MVFVQTCEYGERNVLYFLQSQWRMMMAQRYLIQTRVRVAAVIRIQRAWRSYKASEWYRKLRSGIVMFQAHIRGLLARRRFREAKQAREEEVSQHVLHIFILIRVKQTMVEHLRIHYYKKYQLTNWLLRYLEVHCHPIFVQLVCTFGNQIVLKFEREKFYPGPGIEPRPLALSASALPLRHPGQLPIQGRINLFLPILSDLRTITNSVVFTSYRGMHSYI